MTAAKEGKLDVRGPWARCIHIYSLSLASRVKHSCSVYAPHADRQMGEDSEAPLPDKSRLLLYV
jgi:hypothetical protein